MLMLIVAVDVHVDVDVLEVLSYRVGYFRYRYNRRPGAAGLEV